MGGRVGAFTGLNAGCDPAVDRDLAELLLTEPASLEPTRETGSDSLQLGTGE
jgi:hypothetical protein